VVQAAVTVGEHRKRDVVAHGAGRLLGIGDHRVEDQLEVLHRHAEVKLPAAQPVLVEGDRLAVIGPDQVVDHRDLPDPVAKGARLGKMVLDLAVVIELAFEQVDGDHLPGAQAALFDNPFLGQANHAGLRAGEEQAVFGDRIAQGPQPVAVHAGDRPAPAITANCGRAVPRLHDRVAIAVEIAVRLGHGRVLAPSLGDQHGLDHGQIAPGPRHQLGDRIERRGVRAFRRDDRLQVLDLLAEGLMRYPAFMCFHPVRVALQRVDFAVVGEHAEGLGEAPGRERVGRIALVKNGKVRGEAVVEQIGIETGQLLG
jgi:hypothetical protein